MTLRLTILGCGTSGGVPRIGGIWGDCDPSNPKNWRRRCSLLVERVGPGGCTTVLVDTSPDMREQLLEAGVGRLDGVLYTHDHADHTHGIDELRVVSINMRRKVDVYFDKETGQRLRHKFAYCFETPADSDYPPLLIGHKIQPGRPIRIFGPGGDIVAMPFRQHHGWVESLGFRFGGIAYSSDIKELPEESVSLLQGLDVWIVDALRFRPHPSHFNVAEALEAIARVAPKRAVLTHMHVDLDYEQLSCELPKGVQPAFDGMVLETEE